MALNLTGRSLRLLLSFGASPPSIQTEHLPACFCPARCSLSRVAYFYNHFQEKQTIVSHWGVPWNSLLPAEGGVSTADPAFSGRTVGWAIQIPVANETYFEITCLATVKS